NKTDLRKDAEEIVNSICDTAGVDKNLVHVWMPKNTSMLKAGIQSNLPIVEWDSSEKEYLDGIFIKSGDRGIPLHKIRQSLMSVLYRTQTIILRVYAMPDILPALKQYKDELCENLDQL